MRVVVRASLRWPCAPKRPVEVEIDVENGFLQVYMPIESTRVCLELSYDDLNTAAKFLISQSKKEDTHGTQETDKL